MTNEVTSYLGDGFFLVLCIVEFYRKVLFRAHISCMLCVTKEGLEGQKYQC